MYLTIATKPTAEPVTVAQAKTQCRVDTSDDDTYIGTLITAARRYVERVTNRVLITQTWDWYLDQFPPQFQSGQYATQYYWRNAQFVGLDSFSVKPGILMVPKPPLQSVTYIKYTDQAGTLQTWDASNYTVETDGYEGAIYPVYNGEWPTDVRDHYKAVQIRFVAGYADSGASPVDLADNVPQELKQAILLLVGHLYENREASSQNWNISTVPMAFDALISTYKVHRF